MCGGRWSECFRCKNKSIKTNTYQDPFQRSSHPTALPPSDKPIADIELDLQFGIVIKFQPYGIQIHTLEKIFKAMRSGLSGGARKLGKCVQGLFLSSREVVVLQRHNAPMQMNILDLDQPQRGSRFYSQAMQSIQMRRT